jgi:pyruvate/2-oxoglutarate dehydrogenase complex dihydrolipoamide acyltransferase (E2) component
VVKESTVRVKIVCPNVGEAISEVTLVRWLKRPGQVVEAGEPLFVVNTDKAELEVEAADGGTLAEIVAPDGSAVVPLDVVGYLEIAGG